MVLNVNKQEIAALLRVMQSDQYAFEDELFCHLKEKLKRLQATSEPLKSIIEQVRTTTE
jgi:hypothetical protein